MDNPYLDYVSDEMWAHIARRLSWMVSVHESGGVVQDSPQWPETRELLDVVNILLREEAP